MVNSVGEQKCALLDCAVLGNSAEKYGYYFDPGGL